MSKRHTAHYRLNCVVCGKLFDASRKDARYCSVKCRKQAERWADYIFDKAVTLRNDLTAFIQLVNDPKYHEYVYPLLFWLSSEMREETDRAVEAWRDRTDITSRLEDAETRLAKDRQRQRERRAAAKSAEPSDAEDHTEYIWDHVLGQFVESEAMPI